MIVVVVRSETVTEQRQRTGRNYQVHHSSQNYPQRKPKCNSLNLSAFHHSGQNRHTLEKQKLGQGNKDYPRDQVKHVQHCSANSTPAKA